MNHFGCGSAWLMLPGYYPSRVPCRDMECIPMRIFLLSLGLAAFVTGCISDETREASLASPSTDRGAWRGDTGLTGVGGTGTGGSGQAGAGISGVGVDRQRTTGTGSTLVLTN